MSGDEDLDNLIQTIKTEFDLGSYFSDRTHTEKAERMLDSLAEQLAEQRQQLAVLDEWHCPNCGEVTRARMSDKESSDLQQRIDRARAETAEEIAHELEDGESENSIWTVAARIARRHAVSRQGTPD